MDRELDVQKAPLHVPSFEEVANVLQDGLAKNFADVSVTVVECPDLTQKPFNLAGKGLCGSPRLADVGGVPHLIPLAQTDKIYNLEKIAVLSGLPNAFLLGAGAGPAHVLGGNSECMVNMTSGSALLNKTQVCKMDSKDDSYVLEPSSSTDCMLLMNLFLSEGKPGKVLEVKAKQRTGPDNFMSCMQKTLARHYTNKPVGLGGTFLIEKGKAKIHVMPAHFSEKPLNSDEEVDNWLKFFEMSAPLVCVGDLISYDPDLDLRMEHFHCFSDHGDGGHYHYDTTPKDASYLGYLNVAEFMYRIDRPKETHSIGRD